MIYAKAARKSSPRKGSLFAPTLRSSKCRACRPLRPVRSPEGTAPRVRPDLLPARQALRRLRRLRSSRAGFYGSVEIDINRPVKAFGSILNSVVMELQRSPGAKVKLTLEIEAEAPSGFNDADVRVVHHNTKQLKFTPGSNGLLASVGTAVCLSQLNARPVAAQSSTRVDDRKGRRTGD